VAEKTMVHDGDVYTLTNYPGNADKGLNPVVYLEVNGALSGDGKMLEFTPEFSRALAAALVAAADEAEGRKPSDGAIKVFGCQVDWKGQFLVGMNVVGDDRSFVFTPETAFDVANDLTEIGRQQKKLESDSARAANGGGGE